MPCKSRWWRGDGNLTGTPGRDWLFAGRGDNTIDARGGNDFIWALRGDNHVDAGDGDDWVRTGRGDDSIDAGIGDDYVRAGRGDDHILGASGDDRIRGERGDDYIDGGQGDDHLRGGDGQDEIHGGDGNDLIRGGRGADYLNAGAGDDTVYAGRGDDTCVYSVAENQGSKDYCHGGRGSDLLILQMTHAEYALAKAELDGFEEFLAQSGHGWKHQAYQFESFGLEVKGFERYQVRFTDSEPISTNSSPLAADDNVFFATGVVPIDEIEPNDPNGGSLSDTAQVIERSSFRITPSPDVGDDTLPRVSITGSISGPLPVTGPNANDVDLYAITLKAGEKIILDIDDAFMTGNPVNAQLFLMDESGTVLAENDNSLPGNGGDGSLSFFDSYLEYADPGTGGTYYVAVSTWNNDPVAPFGEFNNLGFAPGDYTLNVSIANPAPDLGAFVITPESLLANDSDADGDPLSIVAVGNAVNGEVELTSGGEILFKSGTNAPGAFDYTVSDGNGGESTATVSVNGDAVMGTPSDDALTGTSEADLFVAGDGSDTFNFATGSGNDVVADFAVGIDTLAITDSMSATGTETLEDDTLVRFDTDDSALLVGVSGVTDVNDLLT